MKKGVKANVIFLCLLFLILDVGIIIAFYFAYSNLFTGEIVKGNMTMEPFTPFEYSLQNNVYKEEVKSEICVVDNKIETLLTRKEFKLQVQGFNRATRIREKVVIPDMNSNVAEETIAITLLGDWREEEGIDGCNFVNDKETQLRIDYCIVPKREAPLAEWVKECRDNTLQYVTTLASSSENAGILGETLKINGKYLLKELGFKILGDNKYVVCTTYIQVTDRLIVTLRAYIKISCLNKVPFIELHETEITDWYLKSTDFNYSEINTCTQEITRMMQLLLGDIFIYETGVMDYTTDYTFIHTGTWKTKIDSVCVDVTRWMQDSYFDRIYLYSDGICYLKELSISSDKINATNRDSLALGMTSDLLEAQLINKIDEKIDGYIIRKVKGITLTSDNRLATMEYFIFAEESILQICLVDYTHSDVDINMESLISLMENKIKGVVKYEN